MTRALVLIATLLSGCTVALSGQESTGSGGTARTTTAATRGHVSVGSAKVGASFGTPAPAGSGGGQVRFSPGASAVLVLSLVLADVVNYLGSPAADAQLAPDPARSIASTCSCYGYQPPVRLTYDAATE
jgi:hypothetical protein